MQEEWRDVIGYEGYYIVSNTGKIKRIKKMPGTSCKILKQTYSYGYSHVNLSKQNTLKRIRVHKIVCQAFLDNPNNKKSINHIDNNRSNNNLSNLEWCTAKENYEHSRIQGRNTRGEKQHSSKLNEESVKEIKKSKLNNAELGRKFNVNKSSIRMIRIGKNWSHVL